MRTEIITAPATGPILLEEVKDHLRLDGSDEDASLGAITASSVALVEAWLDTALIDRTVALYMDQWPESERRGDDLWWNGTSDGAISMLFGETYHIPLPLKPVHTISSVEITAADGTPSVWDASNYYLKPGLAPALARKYGRIWPAPGVPADGIKITLVAGYGPDWNAVPAGIRQALLMLTAHQYYNRGDSATGPALKVSGAQALLTPYRDKRL